MDELDVCIIGAGVVGLAIAKVLSVGSGDLIVLESEADYGLGISSRNSEVIHAGIYYPPDSLKARFCVTGKSMLYDYCVARGVDHRPIGKLIVASTENEISQLEAIAKQAERNGVMDLQLLSAAEARNLEPAIKVECALLSPSTGIINARELMTAYLADAEDQGAMLALHSRVSSIVWNGQWFEVTVRTGEAQSYSFRSRSLVNAAGLGAQEVAAHIIGVDTDIPQLYPCRGSYFGLSGKSPFKHLIYPVPEASGAGLGIHATLDLGGQVRFGPDVEYIDTMDFAVSLSRIDQYYTAVRRYYPGLEDGMLVPGYAGIRPKLQGPGDPPVDFRIDGPDVYGGVPLVQLFGIESPGLTSSLAIAEHVSGLLA